MNIIILVIVCQGFSLRTGVLVLYFYGLGIVMVSTGHLILFVFRPNGTHAEKLEKLMNQTIGVMMKKFISYIPLFIISRVC